MSTLPLPQLSLYIRHSLEQCGVADTEAQSEAKVILEHVSQLSAAQQILFEGVVPQPWQDEIDSILQERKERKPLQYILGYCFFWVLKLKIEPGVFIPRSDTESLVEVCLKIAADEKIERLQIADIGAGSGAISIALLKALPDARVHALEISEVASQLTKQNGEDHGVSNRLTVLTGDWRHTLSHGFQLIVANPPYIPQRMKNTLPPEVKDYEPSQALFDCHPDGLGYYHDFADFLPSHFCQKGGHIVLELGDGQEKRVCELFAERGWLHVKQSFDLNKQARVLSAWSEKRRC